MKRGAIALVTGVILLALLPCPTRAVTSVLDQSNTVLSANVNSTSLVAQTFKAGKTGKVTKVQLYLKGGGTSLKVRIQSTTSGHPSGSNLATSSSATPSPSDPAWVAFNFSAPATVTAGHVYAIVFNMSDAGAATIATGSATNAYANGAALVSTPSWLPINVSFGDFAFRTYVAVTPVVTPKPKPKPTPKPTPSPTPSPTPTPTPTATPSPTPSPTPEITPTPTIAPTPSPTSSAGSGSGDQVGFVPVLPIAGGAVALLGALGGAFWFLVGRKKRQAS